MISSTIVRRLKALALAVAVSLPLLAGAAEKPIKGDPAEFPSEANRAGFDEGRLKVRLSVEPSGEVNRVEVVDANPRRVFDRATVRRAFPVALRRDRSPARARDRRPLQALGRISWRP